MNSFVFDSLFFSFKNLAHFLKK